MSHLHCTLDQVILNLAGEKEKKQENTACANDTSSPPTHQPNSRRETMAVQPLTPISTLPSLPPSTHTHILDLLFEPSTALHTLALPLCSTEPPYSSYPSLITAIQERLTALLTSESSDTQTLNEILGSHPRLGAKKVDSAQSQAEQAQLQGQGEELARLNAEYEARFPGLRYVVFVNGRGREEIMADMRRRIEGGTVEGERAAAIEVSGRACISLR